MSGTYKVKQVLVVRKDLHMRCGKSCSQTAHASLGAYKTADKTDEAFILWDTTQFAKICLYVNSEEELLEIAGRAQEAGLNVCLIKDSGVTEFHGVYTYTCLAIGPHWNEQIDPITKDLKLL